MMAEPSTCAETTTTGTDSVEVVTKVEDVGDLNQSAQPSSASWPTTTDAIPAPAAAPTAVVVGERSNDGQEENTKNKASNSTTISITVTEVPPPIQPAQPAVLPPHGGGGVEPTSRDVILGRGSTGHVMNQLVYDMIRLECILWKLNKRPVPSEVSSQIEAVVYRLVSVIKKGKEFQLAGLKDVPRPFLKSQGRFLTRADNDEFCVMEDHKVISAVAALFLEELKNDWSNLISFSDSPYKELKDMLDRSKEDVAGDLSVVLVPDPKDAILLRRGASNADKLYESHMGNKVVFSLISQVVTTYTNTCDARVEAALNLLQGLQDTTAHAYVSSASDSEAPAGGIADATDEAAGTADPAATNENSAARSSSRRACFLLRNIREDESVFWSILDPADAALFAICFVFEVFLEKEIHLQLPQQSSIVLKDTEPVLVEHSTTVPVENPKDYDVLFGRGGMTNAHPGNRRFRDVIALHRPDYIRALKMDKPGVARKIVKAIRRSGRFMKKGDDGKWYDVGDRTAAEKTSQGLRERSNAEKRQRSALREALRIRRQDMNDDPNDDEKNDVDGGQKEDQTSEEHASKKQKTEHDPARATPNVSILNYVGTNLAVPLSLHMKEPATSAALRRKSSATPVSGRTNNGVELFTEGLPPNAVDEDGNILVTDYDILCGRGGLTNHHKGNKRFRDIVALHRPDYVRAPKIQKPSVARVIVRAIRNGDPPGRFLRKDEKTGKWIDIGDKKAAEKTSQALREKTNEERDKLRSDIVALGGNSGVLLPNPSSYINATPIPVFAAPTLPSSNETIQEAPQRTQDEVVEEPKKEDEKVVAQGTGVSGQTQGEPVAPSVIPKAEEQNEPQVSLERGIEESNVEAIAEVVVEESMNTADKSTNNNSSNVTVVEEVRIVDESSDPSGRTKFVLPTEKPIEHEQTGTTDETKDSMLLDTFEI